MSERNKTLLSSQTIDGDSAVMYWPGGLGNFSAAGTFGSGTVTLKFSKDQGVTWLDVGAYTSLSAAGSGNFQLPACQLKATLSGSTEASVSAEVNAI